MSVNSRLHEVKMLYVARRGEHCVAQVKCEVSARRRYCMLTNLRFSHPARALQEPSTNKHAVVKPQ